MDPVLAKLSETVRAAGGAKRALRLRGGGTKDFYGQALEGEVLDTHGYGGIVAYEPSELVITARCATRLADIETTMSEHGQMLAFEPPHFAQFGSVSGSGATLGGAIAAGLSGPPPQAAGALPDFAPARGAMEGPGEGPAFGGPALKKLPPRHCSRLRAGAPLPLWH